MRTLLSNDRRLQRGPANLGSNMLTYLFVIVMFFTKPKICTNFERSPLPSFLIDTLSKSQIKTASNTFQEVDSDTSLYAQYSTCSDQAGKKNPEKLNLPVFKFVNDACL